MSHLYYNIDDKIINVCFSQDIRLKTDFVFTGDDKIICVSVVSVPIQEHINVHVLEGESHITMFLTLILK